MQRSNILSLRRILCDGILLLSLFLLPWWGSIFIAFAFLFYFVRFYEFVLSILAIGILYFDRAEGYNLIVIALLSAIIFFVVEAFKRRLTFY